MTKATPTWWLSVDGQTLGPYSDSYVQLLKRAGSLPLTAMICEVDQRNWHPLFPAATAGGGQAAAMPVFASAAREPSINAAASKRSLALAWIRGYALFGAPVALLVSFATLFGDGFDFEPESRFYGAQALLWLVALVTQVVAVVLMFLGGIDLSSFQKRSVTLLLSGLAINLVTDILYVIAVVFLVAIASEENLQHINSAPSPILAVTNLLQVAAFLFEGFAFIWLCVRSVKSFRH
jgi:hypothetical protein